MGRPALDETGKRYGRLLVIERDGELSGKAAWSCVCDCGNLKTVSGGGMREGRIVSCGCYQLEVASSKLKKAHAWQRKHKVSEGYTLFRKYKSRIEGRYGIGIQEVVDLQDKQKGCCAICGKSLFIKGLHHEMHIDHDHKTEKVRGLLCKQCNLMLGYSQDKSSTLRRGADYIEKGVEYECL